MKAYVQYIDYSPVTGNIYEPCGDRSVVILDGRRNLASWIEDAKQMNGFHRPVYAGFRIMRGDLHNAVCIHEEIKEG